MPYWATGQKKGSEKNLGRTKSPRRTKPGKNKSPRQNRKKNTHAKEKPKKEKKSRSKRHGHAKNRIENLKILYANVNSLQGKTTSLQANAGTHGSHIIPITETRGKPPKLVLYMPCVHKTRQSRGGGLAITVRDDISNKINVIDDLEDQDQEILWIYWTTIKKSILEHTTENNSHKQKPKSKNWVIMDPSIKLTGDFNAKLKIDKGDKKQT